MLEKMFKSEVKGVVETNIGGLLGKAALDCTLNFNPELTLHFGTKAKSTRQKKQPSKQTNELDRSTTASDNDYLSVDGSAYHVVRPNENNTFSIELRSGRELVIGVAKESKLFDSNDDVGPETGTPKNSRLPQYYSVSCYFEAKFPLDLDFFADEESQNTPNIQYVGVYLVVVTSDKYGEERYILWPSRKRPKLPPQSEAVRTSTTTDNQSESVKVVSKIGELVKSERSLVISREVAGISQTPTQVFYLDWPPEKLGEGSFGAVYSGRDDQNHRVAIKILYQRQFSSSTGLIAVDRESYFQVQQGLPEKALDKSALLGMSHVSILDIIGSLFDGLQKKAKQNDEGVTETDINSFKKSMFEMLSESMNSTDLSRHRFEHESLVDQVMRKSLEDKGISIGRTRYVEVKGYTDKFRESQSFKALNIFHEKMESGNSLNYSDYAIVMKFCQFTLKDLLERNVSVDSLKGVGETADGEIRQETNSNGGGENCLGYDMLGLLPLVDRASIALPYLRGVASALQTIHFADRMHHDIKPGNVFVNSGPGELDVLLGDFSFVGALEEPGSNEAALKDVVGIGEMHYRSPEQNDFIEVMQAAIRFENPEYKIDANTGDGVTKYVTDQMRRDSCFYLRVRDPKFSDSLIRAGDKLVINSDQSGTVYTIDYIRKEQSYWDIWTNVDGATLRKRFLETAKAHVIFFKIPSRKTDLFGLGGLAYELLTAGGSPARFYEKLRAVDQPGTEHSVDELMKYYSNKNGFGDSNTVQPAIRNVLSSFRDIDRNDNAPEWIVEFILKCMAFNIKGSYCWNFENHKSDFVDEFGFEMVGESSMIAVESSAPSRILSELINTLRVKEDDTNFLISPKKSSYLEKVLDRLNVDAIDVKDVENNSVSIVRRIRNLLEY